MSEEKRTPQNKFNKFNAYVTVGNVSKSPGLLPSLGSKGIQLKLFSDEFNKATKGLKTGLTVSVNIAYQKGGKFHIMKIKSMSVSSFIKEKISLKKGSPKPGINIVAELSMKDANEIAEQKINDMNVSSIEMAVKTVIGTAKSMGVNVV